MKKLLTISILTLSILSLTFYFNQFSSKIFYISTSIYNQSTNTFNTHILDENGEEYIVNTYDYLGGQWIDATVKNDQVISFKVMD